MARAWNKRIDKFFVEQGFKKCLAEHEVYVKGSEGTSLLIICLYVDDLMLTGSINASCKILKTSNQS
jgi:hypothetical protein